MFCNFPYLRSLVKRNKDGTFTGYVSVKDCSPRAKAYTYSCGIKRLSREIASRDAIIEIERDIKERNNIFIS